ncbi:MAG: SpoIIE family protein phosphatase [Melioribacteraceae bacterium]|nr:SpoIIE family protein phosphatase [Melioribacteraceae bacterium]MCF8354008.1 SpoIIE family protein phosphatase [Melioribacteraceae bacterium]MCF8392311.1 SpoIIE family protein phosphatase [Melioribacteraceae bacterium]MCF8417643.1 SpoIIE family protein phosphatase [Melioribacteraceae bacterium]
MKVTTVKDKITSELTEHKIKVLLIDDQKIIGEAVRRMLVDESDIEFHFLQDPTKAIETANELTPTVILQDLVMPEIDGLMLVKFFRGNESTKDIPLIVLSSKEEAKTKAEAFARGANDYLVKLPDKIELIARIRYHSKGYINLLQRNEAHDAMIASQNALKEEIAEAADYVRSLLPERLNNGIKSDWKFIPSTTLGGDSFGYHWIDEDNFAIYLLDVCGHGVGAALLSISAMNVLRSASLPDTDFREPGSVLTGLNNAFPMEKQDNKFFTIWYGVYNKINHEIKFSSGGHPPAVLLTGESVDNHEVHQLFNKNLAIGYWPDFQFKSNSIKLGNYSKVFIYSDGCFEVNQPDGDMMSMEYFIDLLSKSEGVDDILKQIREIKGDDDPFDDDYSMLEVDLSKS